jgi:hypothetical protein
MSRAGPGRGAAARALRPERVAAVRAEARVLVRRLGLTLPIDVAHVAAVLGADVIDAPLGTAQAQILRWRGRARIRVDHREAHPGARRFSIGHELGHLWLGHPGGIELARCAPTVVAGRETRGVETEANAFASELLLPAPLVAPWTGVTDPDLGHARSLAAAAGVSLTAAALRLCELSTAPCAVLRCHRGRITWATRSPTFAGFLPRGRIAGPDAAVTELLAWGRLPREPRPVPASTWLGAAATGATVLIEHATTLPGSEDVLCWLRIATA